MFAPGGHKVVHASSSAPSCTKALRRKESQRILLLIQKEEETCFWTKEDTQDQHLERLSRAKSIDEGVLRRRASGLNFALRQAKTFDLGAKSFTTDTKLSQVQNHSQIFSTSEYKSDDETSENDMEKPFLTGTIAYVATNLPRHGSNMRTIEWLADSSLDVTAANDSGVEMSERGRDSGIERDDGFSDLSNHSSFSEKPSSITPSTASVQSKNLALDNTAARILIRNKLLKSKLKTLEMSGDPALKDGSRDFTDNDRAYLESRTTEAMEMPEKFERHLIRANTIKHERRKNQPRITKSTTKGSVRKSRKKDSALHQDSCKGPVLLCTSGHIRDDRKCIFDVDYLHDKTPTHVQSNSRKSKSDAETSSEDDDVPYAFEICAQNIRQIFTHCTLPHILHFVESAVDFDINCVDYFGNAPLHYAALRGDPEILKLALELGANVWIRNKNHSLPVDLCTSMQCGKLLISATMFYGSRSNWRADKDKKEIALRDIIYEL